MPQRLNYGASHPLELDIPSEALLADLSKPPTAIISDPAAAVAAALEDPLDFPPLAAAAVPGDRVVLAIERAVPQAEAVVAGIVSVLLESGVCPSDLTIVFGESGAAGDPDPTALLPEDVRREIAVQSHDGSKTTELAYLAATRDGRPLYINRRLCDADVVVPIGSVRLEAQPDYIGVYGGLFPGFADRQTRRRFALPAAAKWTMHQRQRRAEAAEAAWLLGVQFTVQVVPGGSDALLHVLAGEAASVAQRGQQLCRIAWQRSVASRASLVVAAVEGGPQHQTWENVGRALYAAARVATADGDIVVCSNLRREPGPLLRRAAAPYVPDFEHLYSEEEETADETGLPPAHDAGEEALSACMLSDLLEHNRVYLLSGLEEDVVEDLGLAYVDEPDDISRLAARHDSCILLASAQYAIPSVCEA
jgi:nickel-dependent lactate racemase